jgi:lipopolysaccharide export system permease protein
MMLPRLLPGRVERYVLREVFYGLLMVLGVIVLAIVLVDVIEQMRTVGSRTQIDIFEAFQLTLYKTPQLVQQTLPFAMLVGAIISYSRLSRRSEIPAIRAAGLSAWSFLFPAVAVAAIAGGVMVMVLDPLATRLNADFEIRRNQLLDAPTRDPRSKGGLWLSQGDAENMVGNDDGVAIINAQKVIGRAQALEDVTFFYFRPNKDGSRDFTHRIDAKRAVLTEGFWQLTGVVENMPGGVVARHDNLAVTTTLKADTLLSRFASSDTIPFWELPNFIAATRSAGLDVDPYVLKFHTLLATPVLMIAMSLIGAVVCLRLARSGGVSQLIATGAFSGLGLFFVTEISKGLSGSGATPPEAAAWCPPLVALFAVLTVIAHAEDG